ncbi:MULTISPECIES: hypothetical protein [Janthinobacterium]|uniref:Uncharacterized protein n=1 Tax=Janthinobacterium violaceinigrum TaxID=2654252 RepID=A0A6I1IE50_9BURK|nr:MULTISPECIES: hypothetical protein [Janthinobacterium]KAB8065558.1 hypothetical protein GCN75_07190 [Janthinobacterium violaceinigrum]MED5597687.1 hypothetical protein [Janthinobacterium sp. P210006]
MREKIGEKRHKSTALLYFCNARFLRDPAPMASAFPSSRPPRPVILAYPGQDIVALNQVLQPALGDL